jgi:hypothetical protein
MRLLAKTALALGVLGAAALGGTGSVMAQGFYFNVPGVHVHVGHPYHHYYRGYYDYYPGPAGGGWDTYNGCPPHYTIQGGVCQPYRGD